MSVVKRLTVVNVIGKKDLLPDETLQVMDITTEKRSLFVNVWNLDRLLNISVVMQKHDPPVVGGVYVLRHIGPAWALDEVDPATLSDTQRDSLVVPLNESMSA